MQPMQRSMVLSVEDDESRAYILAEAFAEVDASIRVIRVSDGEEALAFLNRSAPFQSAPIETSLKSSSIMRFSHQPSTRFNRIVAGMGNDRKGSGTLGNWSQWRRR
jgi:CheY-like chemotaxis protein